jgi:hypothetical protein
VTEQSQSQHFDLTPVAESGKGPFLSTSNQEVFPDVSFGRVVPHLNLMAARWSSVPGWAEAQHAHARRGAHITTSPAVAKGKGVYRVRKRALTAEQVAAIRQRSAAGEHKAALAREFNVSRETLHQSLRPSYST